MEAYGYYLKAREADDNFFYADARKFAEKAVALDPTFALAYYVLASAAGNLLDDPAANKALEKAKIYSSRATERERLFIESKYAGSIERDPAKELRYSKDLDDKYPEDKEADFELGPILSSNRDPEAIGELEKAIAIDQGTAAPSMSWAMPTRAGDSAKAVQSFERYAERIPGFPTRRLDRQKESFMGNLDVAAAKYREALAIKPDLVTAYPGLAYVYALKEDYREGERWIEEYPQEGAGADGPTWTRLISRASTIIF